MNHSKSLLFSMLTKSFQREQYTSKYQSTLNGRHCSKKMKTSVWHRRIQRKRREKVQLMRLARIESFFFSFFSLTLRRFRLTVATTFRLSVFFCLSSICCLLCIMSNFFHFLFHPELHFFTFFFSSSSLQCKQVRTV